MAAEVRIRQPTSRICPIPCLPSGAGGGNPEDTIPEDSLATGASLRSREFDQLTSSSCPGQNLFCVFTNRKGDFKALFKKKRSLYCWENLKCHQTCFQESLTVFGNIRPACTLEHVCKAWRDSAAEIKAFQHFEECLELSLLIFQASLYLRLKDAFHRKIFFS